MEEGVIVSVICPVFNAEQRLPALLEALDSQTIDNRFFEVIFVNNLSEDGSLEILQNTCYKVLSCNTPKSSYSARNVGIEASSGSILAFIDDDCLPSTKWLENGLDYFKNTPNTDLIGGKIEFKYKNPKSPWETYDALSNMDNQFSVAKGHAKTANLFVKKSVFQEIGLFLNGISSGGDVEFTYRATSRNFRLVYGENVIVQHPTRTRWELKTKSIRVARGQARLQPAIVQKLMLTAKYLLPISHIKLLRKYREKRSTNLWFAFHLLWVSVRIKCLMAIELWRKNASRF